MFPLLNNTLLNSKYFFIQISFFCKLALPVCCWPPVLTLILPISVLSKAISSYIPCYTSYKHFHMWPKIRLDISNFASARPAEGINPVLFLPQFCLPSASQVSLWKLRCVQCLFLSLCPFTVLGKTQKGQAVSAALPLLPHLLWAGPVAVTACPELALGTDPSWKKKKKEKEKRLAVFIIFRSFLHTCELLSWYRHCLSQRTADALQSEAVSWGYVWWTCCRFQHFCA